MKLRRSTRETLPPDTDGQPEGSQYAWRANINVLIPGTDEDGNPIDQAAAIEHISRALHGVFLDWRYTNRPDGDNGPVRIEIDDPYVEGSV